MTEAPDLYHFLSGAAATASAIVALFFLRFHKKTGERLFGIFAASFSLLALERMILIAVQLDDELKGAVYVLRLAAFVLILIAVADKNRSASREREVRLRRSRTRT